MEKDTHLVNIYLKIYHKRSLTIDDLRYLAKYDPECFEKTCKNVVYNAPETKPIMEPAVKETREQVQRTNDFVPFNIERVLENLKHLERKDLPMGNMDADKVKNLLGSLYMEMLFPHNDKETHINMSLSEQTSVFDKKA